MVLEYCVFLLSVLLFLIGAVWFHLVLAHRRGTVAPMKARIVRRKRDTEKLNDAIFQRN